MLNQNVEMTKRKFSLSNVDILAQEKHTSLNTFSFSNCSSSSSSIALASSTINLSYHYFCSINSN